jgi:hypothetical protein
MQHKKKKPPTKEERIKHEENYVEFLRTRLESENYKAAVTADEYAATKAKYEKAKFKLKMLKTGK